jgi:hypothetical protein
MIGASASVIALSWLDNFSNLDGCCDGCDDLDAADDVGVIFDHGGIVIDADGYVCDYRCIDCKRDTSGRHPEGSEYYMVHDALWREVVGSGDAGMICIGCLESRIWRELTSADFSGAPINWPNPGDSPRLAARKRARKRARS